MSEKEAIIAALNHRVGMTAEHSARLEAFNEKQTDWFTTCPKCHAELRGSLAEMRKHACGTEG